MKQQEIKITGKTCPKIIIWEDSVFKEQIQRILRSVPQRTGSCRTQYLKKTHKPQCLSPPPFDYNYKVLHNIRPT